MKSRSPAWACYATISLRSKAKSREGEFDTRGLYLRRRRADPGPEMRSRERHHRGGQPQLQRRPRDGHGSDYGNRTLPVDLPALLIYPSICCKLSHRRRRCGSDPEFPFERRCRLCSPCPEKITNRNKRNRDHDHTHRRPGKISRQHPIRPPSGRCLVARERRFHRHRRRDHGRHQRAGRRHRAPQHDPEWLLARSARLPLCKVCLGGRCRAYWRHCGARSRL